MATYLITGGAGFIGSHLANALASNGDHITIIDDLSIGNYDNISNIPNINFIHGSILNNTILEEFFSSIDGIFHLAAIASVQKSINDWHYSHQVNLTASINVFLQAAKNNIPVVYASSAAVYGAEKNLPLRETSPITPLSPYAADKYNCEVHARLLGKLKGLKSFGLRFFNVYGQGQNSNSDYSGVISIFKQQIAKREKLTIFGDGEQYRDFIHVSDVVNAIILAMNHTSNEGLIANICTGKPHTLNQLLSIISKTHHIEGVKYEDDQLGSVKYSVGDPSFAKKTMGFSARQNFELKIAELFLAD
ncbi:MAG: NAD-dependent epimerase/dehydratase family protein [Rickettsiaceae bacterium]|nr:MAG: NAD-dependent epimerase/dehydratase family protein [Rickettsiaceae bacterium]